MPIDGPAAAALAAREAHGRLVALLASRTGDLAGAQDALADAFEAALLRWPADGVPANPQAWLLTVARNRQLDRWRSAADRTRASLDDAGPDTLALDDPDPDAIPDRRLALLFVCAHPAIDAGVRAPLMMQTVLGLDAAAIARAFLVPAGAMAARLVRAKRKIKDAGIAFDLPGRSDMTERLEAVLEAVWGAYAIGWDLAGELATGDADRPMRIWPTRRASSPICSRGCCPTIRRCWAWRLASRCRRRAARARIDAHGDFVPLDDQDVTRWDAGLIDRGERLLRRAHAQGAVGRFQLEAAIQSAHVARTHTGVTDWASLALLHEGLVRMAPSVGAWVARAAAVGHAHGPLQGLAALDAIDPRACLDFQPAWATRAHLLALAGRRDEALQAWDRAIELSPGGAGAGGVGATTQRAVVGRAWLSGCRVGVPARRRAVARGARQCDGLPPSQSRCPTSEARCEISMKLPSGSRTNEKRTVSPSSRGVAPSVPPRARMPSCSRTQSRTCTVV